MPRQVLEITTETCEDSLVVKLVGAADSSTAEALRKRLEHVRRNGNRRVVIDCSDLRYANSTSLGHLAAFRKQMYIAGGRVVLAGVRGPVAQSMKLLRLDKVFRVYPDLAAALENINKDTIIGDVRLGS